MCVFLVLPCLYVNVICVCVCFSLLLWLTGGNVAGGSIEPAVPDTLLSAAFCLRLVGIKSGIYFRGQAGQDTGRQAGREGGSEGGLRNVL